MPYNISHEKGGYHVVEAGSGDRPGHSFSKKPQSKAKAEAQQHLLQGVEHGWKPTYGKCGCGGDSAKKCHCQKTVMYRLKLWAKHNG